MVSHELVRWATTFLIDATELDWSRILHFWHPNQHFGERMTENLDRTLHSDTAKTVRPAASPWVLLVQGLQLLCDLNQYTELFDFQ